MDTNSAFFSYKNNFSESYVPSIRFWQGPCQNCAIDHFQPWATFLRLNVFFLEFIDDYVVIMYVNNTIHINHDFLSNFLEII